MKSERSMKTTQVDIRLDLLFIIMIMVYIKFCCCSDGLGGQTWVSTPIYLYYNKKKKKVKIAKKKIDNRKRDTINKKYPTL